MSDEPMSDEPMSGNYWGALDELAAAQLVDSPPGTFIYGDELKRRCGSGHSSPEASSSKHVGAREAHDESDLETDDHDTKLHTVPAISPVTAPAAVPATPHAVVSLDSDDGNDDEPEHTHRYVNTTEDTQLQGEPEPGRQKHARHEQVSLQPPTNPASAPTGAVTAAAKLAQQVNRKGPFFIGVVALLIFGESKKQKALFAKKITEGGGKVVNVATPHLTHIITDLEERVVAKLKPPLVPSPLHPSVLVLKDGWMSKSLSLGELVNDANYRISVHTASSPSKTTSKHDLDNSTGADADAGSANSSPKRLKVEDGNEPALLSSTQQSFDNELRGIAKALEQAGKFKSADDHEMKKEDEDYIENEYDEFDPQTAEELKRELKYQREFMPRGKWACAQDLTSATPVNLNAHITKALGELKKHHEAMPGTDHHWRAYSYGKAISKIASYPKPIESREDAVKAVSMSDKSKGHKIADKIEELLETGKIAKLENFKQNEHWITLNKFCEIWGVGSSIAHDLYVKGYRSLADLTDPNHPGTLQYGEPLSKNQRVGLQFVEEFKQRIPRSEVEEVEKIVRAAAQELRPGTIVTATGSYRRGKETCGDIDLLITHENSEMHHGILLPLVRKLEQMQLLTHHLVVVKDASQHKYMGVCQLNGLSHRRIDILVVPIKEWPFALIHFTGNDYLNRSMRWLAHFKDMHLSEKGLFAKVTRNKSERLNEGTRVPNIKTEEDVFEALGLKYRPPADREV